MPSPFPGMNPYLEQDDAWEDFHPDFMRRAREQLNAQVGNDYIVKVELRLYYREPPAQERIFFARADVGLTEQTPSSGASTLTVAAPMKLVLPTVDVEKQAYLEIRDRRNRRVVTVIELLSPCNKTTQGDGADYRAKRQRLLSSATHFVELDLLRGGVRPSPPAVPPCDYYAMVSRVEDRPGVGFWPIHLRDPLPTLPIPLSAPDRDVTLDVQQALHHVYDAAGFAKYIYQSAPQPPLLPGDVAWAATILANTAKVSPSAE